MLKMGFDNIRLAEAPYPIDFDEDSGRIIAVPAIQTFVESASVLLEKIEILVEMQTRNAEKSKQ